jgi:hypothetical protein
MFSILTNTNFDSKLQVLIILLHAKTISHNVKNFAKDERDGML